MTRVNEDGCGGPTEWGHIVEHITFFKSGGERRRE